MSDKKPEPPNANVGWQESKSKKGKGTRVRATPVDATGPPFSNVQVNWTVGSSGPPSPEVQATTAIVWYSLDSTEWWDPYDYQLTIKCTDTYDYEFDDATGDAYEINVFSTGTTHEVQYNSSNPTIVSISGS